MGINQSWYQISSLSVIDRFRVIRSLQAGILHMGNKSVLYIDNRRINLPGKHIDQTAVHHRQVSLLQAKGSPKQRFLFLGSNVII